MNKIKKFYICPQCIAKAKTPSLNQAEISLEITKCSECGKYGFMRELNAGYQLFLKAGQKKEANRKAESVKAFQKAKAEKKAEVEKIKVVRKPIKLRAISLI